MKSLNFIFLFIISAVFLLGATAHSAATKADADQENYRAMFYGVIEHTPENERDGIWVVNEREILIVEDTIFEEEFGKAEIGAYVEIEGNYEEKIFKAYKVEVKKSKN